jgi:hypothetical protein
MSQGSSPSPPTIVLYGSCAQVCVRTLTGNGKAFNTLRQIVLALVISRYRGNLNSILTASILLESAEAYNDSIEGC